MKINELHIRRLFGIYDYNIHFNDPLTIITGPNGYGKTTILKIINSLNSERLYFFYTLKYESIEFVFDDASTLFIKKTDVPLNESEGSDEAAPLDKVVKFVWKKGEVSNTFTYNSRVINNAKRLVSTRQRLSYHISDTESIEEANAPMMTENFNRLIAKENNQLDFLLKLDSIKTSFISINRIEKNTDGQYPISEIVENIKHILFHIRFEKYLTKLSDLNDKLIQDIVNNPSMEECSEEQYNDLRKEVVAKYNTLIKYGITSQVPIPEYQPNNGVRYLFLKGQADIVRDCYKEIQKVEIYDRLLSSKDFSHKKILFGPDFGMRAVSINDEGESVEFLNLLQLSSGEQEELVMLYMLIFEGGKNSIYMIDEPENSLHVVWQRNFVEDLREISKYNDFQTIVATHSPTIVRNGDGSDIDLYYLTKEA